MTALTKACRKCGETKSASTDFGADRSTKDGMNRWCRNCCRISQATWYNTPENRLKCSLYGREWRKRNPDKKAAHNERNRTKDRETGYYRHRLYGITLQQTRQILAEQHHACGACRKPFEKKFCVDHCHATKKIRGILCNACNSALGYARDDRRILLGLMAYLRKHSRKELT